MDNVRVARVIYKNLKAQADRSGDYVYAYDHENDDAGPIHVSIDGEFDLVELAEYLQVSGILSRSE